VENRPGAGGTIGTALVAKAAPDGYTLAVVSAGHAINPAIYDNLPYDSAKDLSGVIPLASLPSVLVVTAALGVKSMQELVALAKAKPGALTYGSFGTGSLPQIGFEALNVKLGMDLMHVPYKSASLAVTGVLAGEIDITASSAAGVIGNIRAGKLRPIAIGSPRRSLLLPNVPTLAESGVSEDTLPPTFFAFALPAGTPKPIVVKLSSEIRRIVHSKETAERLIEAGLEPFGSSSEEMTEIVRRDVPRFSLAVKAIGIQPE
jgi:tripartite-type tricarboxylate transporter receptor subunit TctC